MSGPEHGHNTPSGESQEAAVLEAREGVKERRMDGNGKSWDMLWKVLSIVAVPWAMWASAMLIDVRERVAVIEGNRFDSDDAYRLMMIVNDKADKSEVPPAWFLREFNDLERAFLSHLEDSR